MSVVSRRTTDLARQARDPEILRQLLRDMLRHVDHRCIPLEGACPFMMAHELVKDLPALPDAEAPWD